MTTAIQIVDSAAQKLGVKTAETALEAEDSQVIFDEMNDMLSDWSDSGLTPAFVEVFDLGDDVQIDRNAVGAVKSNLALRCAPIFSRSVPQSLALDADTTRTRLLASVVKIGTVAFPDTLPRGSGNGCSDTFVNDRFFAQNKTENF
jgi:hypothetical protein